MHKKIFQVALSVILILGLMPTPGFAASGDGLSPKARAQEDSLSAPVEKPRLGEGVLTGEGVWGNARWEWDDSTSTLTVFPGTAGPANEAPWYYELWPADNPNGGIRHIVFKQVNDEKVIFPDDCSYLFAGKGGLTSMNPIKSIDFSGADTSQVTKMGRMFFACMSLTTLDLSALDTEHVTNMSGMFANCSSLTSLDLSGFKSSNVTTMNFMFSDCVSLGSISFSDFKTDKVEDMYGMFYGANSLISLDLSSFNTANVTNMASMFQNCTSLQSLNLSSFATSDDTSMGNMFNNCSALANISLGAGIKNLPYLPEYPIQGHTDWFSESAKSWFTSQEIDAYRLGIPDTYYKYVPKPIENVTVEGITDKTYTGSAIYQTFVVTDGDTTLQEDVDYWVRYENNVNPGTATVIITGKNQYTGSVNKTFTITARDITTASVLGIEDKVYTGSEITQTITVKDGDKTLQENTDYTTSYLNNINPGTASLTITGKGGYTGTINKDFTITAKDISAFSVTGIENKEYTGSEITQSITVKDGDKTLQEDTDYTTSYLNNINPGTASLTITGKGVYTGSINKDFTITAKDISGFSVTGIEDKVYTGSEITQSITVKDGDKTLQENIDYTTSYLNNINPGTASLTIAGKGRYTGSISSVFSISAFPRGGEWGTCTWTWDDTTKTMTVFPGEINSAQDAPWYYRKWNEDFPNGGVLHIVFKEENDKKVIFPEDCSYLFSALSDTAPNPVQTIDFSGASTIKTKYMDSMFENCKFLSSLNLSYFDTPALESMQLIFFGCSSLTSVEISSFKTSKVTNMFGAFSGCTSLTSLDLSHFNTAALEEMDNMFENCSALEQIALGEGVTKLDLLPQFALKGHTDWYSRSENKWFTADEIANNRLGMSDTYTKTPRKDISNITFSLSQMSFSFDMKEHVPTLWSISDPSLVEGKDFIVKYSNPHSIYPGIYSVWLEGVGECVGKSEELHYTIYDVKAQPITIQPQQKITATTGTVKPIRIALTAKPVYGGTLRFQWYKDGNAIKGATKPTYTIPVSLTLKAQRCTYYCMVTEVVGDRKFTTKSHNSTLIIKEPLSFTQMIPKGKTSLVIKWNKEANADGYDLFFSRCNHGKVESKCKKIKTIKGNNTLSYTKTKLLAHTSYKSFVRPFKMVKGKKVYLSTSPQAHIYTAGGNKDYSSPKKLVLNKTKISIKAKKSFQLKVKITLIDAKKKLMTDTHAPAVRYISSDTSIAKVSKKGKIVGVAKGSCTVYAITQNGLRAAVEVKVN